jgi:hypothetical protein
VTNTPDATLAQLSMDLSAELASNDLEERVELAYVDPRSIPSRFSLIKQMALSAAHYEYACQLPQDDSMAARLGGLLRGIYDKREALRFGSAVHHMLLGTPENVALFTGAKRAGKAWAAFQDGAIAEGRTVILNQREHAQAVAVAGAIRRHTRAMDLLFDGATAVIEQRIDWEFLGRAFRSTPDTRCKAKRYIADLKTTVSAQPSQFSRHALRFFYHAQAALYAEAVEQTEGWTPADLFAVAVEKSPPYPVTIFRFTDEAIEVGRKLLRLWMEKLATCEKSGEYPGYSESEVELDVPRYDEPFAVEIDGRSVEVA